MGQCGTVGHTLKQVGRKMVNQWGTIGIPSENRFLGLYYEPESKQFLAHFYKRLGDGFGLKSIYARHITDETYRRITPETDELSYEDIILHQGDSRIFVNVFSVHKRGSKITGYEWHSIQEIDTDSGEITTVLTPHELPVEPPYSKAWISRLRNVKIERGKPEIKSELPDDDYIHFPKSHAVYSSRGNEILCTVSFKKRKSGHEESVDDFLCKFSTETGEYKKITKIKTPPTDIINYENAGRESLARAGS
jgi:hypothetical protein